MSIFTTSQFATVAQSRIGSKSFKSIVAEVRNLARASNQITVFLSHSHTDKSLVEQGVAFLRGFNIDVYVDWMDETMSEKPNGITAQKIKSKIVSNDKFFLLATNAAVISKWCNWEVGIGDVHKFLNDKICLLPLADNSGHWTGNEYLQIYPRVEAVDNGPGKIYDSIFKLHYPDGKTLWFDEWLKK